MSAAVLVAHGFKKTSFAVIERYAGSPDPTIASGTLAPVLVVVIVSASVMLAAVLGHALLRRWSDHVGIEAVAASARGEARRISLRATAGRTFATWVVATGLASIGRESAIVETGGAIGSVAGRRFKGRGDALAAAGVAAAFAAAYHAPLAAAFYVEEHLGVRRSRRGLRFTIVGALGGHALSVGVLGGHAVLPGIQGTRRSMLVFALVGLVPAALSARLFLQLRQGLTGVTLARRFGCRRWIFVAVMSLVAGLVVAALPLASGNGSEALRHASADVSWKLAIALGLGKLLATTASLGAGAPGGVLTPTITIAAGSALLALLGVGGLGVTIVHPWDAMVVSMAVGVTVGMRAPLVAVFLIPEMLGDYSLVPVVALVVAVAVVLDRGLDRAVARIGLRIPSGVHDEDA